MGQGQRALAEHFKESRTKPHARPDLKYLGPDPSTKTEEEFYGIDATAELDLVKAMLPGGLEHGLKKGICQAITDVVALPGGYQTNAFDGEEGLALFTQSMAEMAHGGKSENEIFSKPDFNWRASGRTGLKTITTDEKLRHRVKVLVKLGQRVRKQTVKLLINGLKRAGWTDESEIAAWAQGGPIYRLVTDCLDYNLSLHQHLLSLSASTMDWSYVQTEVDHHVEELGLIRSVADSRIQALVHLYCYLRDGHAGTWQSASLQAIRNVEMFTQKIGGSSPVRGNYVNEKALCDLCPKCGTTLHAGGMKACPWANLSNKKAKLAAATFMRGGCGLTTPEKTDDGD
jgi:hypothetical protein